MGTELSAGTWLREGLWFSLSWVKNTPALEPGVKTCHSSPRWHSGKPFLPSLLFLYLSCLVLQGWRLFSAMDNADVVCVIKTALRWCWNAQNSQGRKGCPRLPGPIPQFPLENSTILLQIFCLFLLSCPELLDDDVLLPGSSQPPPSSEHIPDLVGKPSMCTGVGSGQSETKPTKNTCFYPSEIGWMMEMFIIIYFHALVRTCFWGPHVNSLRK